MQRKKWWMYGKEERLIILNYLRKMILKNGMKLELVWGILHLMSWQKLITWFWSLIISYLTY